VSSTDDNLGRIFNGKFRKMKFSLKIIEFRIVFSFEKTIMARFKI
jgi:hypothetical protein